MHALSRAARASPSEWRWIWIPKWFTYRRFYPPRRDAPLSFRVGLFKSETEWPPCKLVGGYFANRFIKAPPSWIAELTRFGGRLVIETSSDCQLLSDVEEFIEEVFGVLNNFWCISVHLHSSISFWKSLKNGAMDLVAIVTHRDIVTMRRTIWLNSLQLVGLLG